MASQDIDALLQEVDDVLKDDSPTTRRAPYRSSAGRPSAPAPRSENRHRPQPGTDDIDSLLAEMEGLGGDDDAPRRPPATQSRSHESRAPSTASRTQGRASGSSAAASEAKCALVRLGGARDPTGHTSSFASRTVCGNLHCTSCDFPVLRFPGHAWRDDAGYIFFRNNMPDEHKLRPMLRTEGAAAAYCCQCSWTTVSRPCSISLGSKYDAWVCAGCRPGK